MFMSGTTNIREVIAFPKTQRAQCLMTGAPSSPSNEAMRELGLKIKEKQ